MSGIMFGFPFDFLFGTLCLTNYTPQTNMTLTYKYVKHSVRTSVQHPVWNSVRLSVEQFPNSIRNSIKDSVWNSVMHSVWNSITNKTH
jgi:hypothetical protein